MKSLKYLIIVACFAITTQAVSIAQSAIRAQLVGIWDEVHPKDNLVYFAKDGSWKLYLEEGEIGTLRSLNGTWSLSDDGKLTIAFTVNDQKQSMVAKVTFDGEEMVLTEQDGSETRHRRHKGPIPERFQW